MKQWCAGKTEKRRSPPPSTFPKVLLIALILPSALLWASCSPSVAKPSPPTTPPATDLAAHVGVVTAVDGDIQAKQAGVWVPLEAGDRVSEHDVIKTGVQSSCDIQFAKTGVLHLSSETTIALDTISLAEDRNLINVQLVVGTVTSKVAKLVGDDRYQVHTKTVVAGVRGTRFTVSQGSDETTAVAVKEGAVALYPPSFDPVALEVQASSPDQRAVVATVCEKVASQAQLVASNTKVVVTKASIAEADSRVTRVVQALQAIHPEPSSLQSSLDTLLKTIAQEAVEPPMPLDSQTQKTFQDTQNLQILDALPEKVDRLLAPEAVSPVNQEPVDINKVDSIRLSWKPVAGAKSYRVDLYGPETRKNEPLKTWTTKDTFVTITQFEQLSTGLFSWDLEASADTAQGRIASEVVTSTFEIVKGQTLKAPSIKGLRAPKLTLPANAGQ